VVYKDVRDRQILKNPLNHLGEIARSYMLQIFVAARQAELYLPDEICKHFRNKKKAYLKSKIEELETNSKINNIRDLYRGIN
jgi:predicted nucleic acid-binding protein